MGTNRISGLGWTILGRLARSSCCTLCNMALLEHHTEGNMQALILYLVLNPIVESSVGQFKPPIRSWWFPSAFFHYVQSWVFTTSWSECSSICCLVRSLIYLPNLFPNYCTVFYTAIKLALVGLLVLKSPLNLLNCSFIFSQVEVEENRPSTHQPSPQT